MDPALRASKRRVPLGRAGRGHLANAVVPDRIRDRSDARLLWGLGFAAFRLLATPPGPEGPGSQGVKTSYFKNFLVPSDALSL
jgi:hypothetical protein